MKSTKLLQVIQGKLDNGAAHLRHLCSPAGQFDPGLLDQHQQVAFELASCTADLAAARSLACHAQQSGDSRCEALARAYQADVIQQVWGRLLRCAPGLGLQHDELLAVAASEPFRQLSEQASPQCWAGLGRAAIDSGDGRYATGLDEVQEQVRTTFRRFSEQRVAPLAEQIHREDLDIPDALIEEVAELGCFGTCIPLRYGGTMPDERADSLGMIVVTEELSRGSLGAAGSLVTRPEIAARALLAQGSEKQRALWLPRLASGATLAAISITEPDVGSDVAAVSLRARREDDEWILDGAKTWCTFAGKADLLVVLARTGPEQGHRGLSLFMVEKPRSSGHVFEIKQPTGGSLSGRAIATLGYRGMHSYDLHFDQFRLPGEALVGGPTGQGKGFYAAMAGFAGGRIQTAARATGLVQAAVEASIAQVSQRRVFGQSLGEYQLSQVKLGKMMGLLHASRQFAYAVARKMSEGEGQMEASLVKLFSCRAAEWVCREAVQLHGGMGYAEESAVSRYFVDARVLSIFEGAEETLALKVIARDLVTRAGGSH